MLHHLKAVKIKSSLRLKFLLVLCKALLQKYVNIRNMV